MTQKIGFVEGGNIKVRDRAFNVIYILLGMVFDSEIHLSLWGEKKNENRVVFLIVIELAWCTATAMIVVTGVSFFRTR